ARPVQELPRVVGTLVGGLDAELDVTAEREERHPVVGLAAVPAEQPGAEAEREGHHAHAEGLGDEKMAGLVHEDDGAEREGGGEDGGDERGHGASEFLSAVSTATRTCDVPWYAVRRLGL